MRYPTVAELTPFFRMASVVLNTADMVKKGVPANLRNLLLPSLATTYGPAIIMNSINHSLDLSTQSFLIYVISFYLSMFLYSNKIFIYLIKELPNVAKVVSSIDLIRDTKPIGSVIVNQITAAFTVIIIKKLVLRKKLRIKNSEIINIIVFNAGLALIKEFELPELSVVVVIYSVPLINRFLKFLAVRRNTKTQAKKRQQPILHTPLSKLPRRRASVAASMANNKNKEL